MLTIVNEGSSLTIVNETTKFIKTVVFEKTIVLFLCCVVVFMTKLSFSKK